MNAHGSSMTNTVQQIAGSIGTAALITILSSCKQKTFLQLCQTIMA